MTLYRWSQNANSDATADSTCPWPEGMPPSQVNDSARGMMAATAKFRDDIAGAIVTTGTSTNYAVSSYQQFDTLAHLHGQVIAFTPHTTNTGAQAFLNVDSLGLKTIRSATGIDIPAGTLIQGTPYEAVYNNTDGIFYLKGFYGNPYSIPLGATIEYWAGATPNSSFAFPYGQAISRTTYSALFALIGANYGSGDGSTTFNLPDIRGRVTACVDNMGGSDAGRLSGNTVFNNRLVLGGNGGEVVHTLTVNEMPAHGHTANVSDPGHSHTTSIGNTQIWTSAGPSNIGGSPNTAFQPAGLSINSASTGIGVSINNNGGGVAHNVVQPTILCNRIMRII